MNTFGNNLRLTTFGESHGVAMGGVLDGVPPRMRLDIELISKLIDERRTGGNTLVSSRKESDTPEFLSGLTPDGVTLGTPIAFIVRNTGHRSADYETLRHIYRPNHADFTYDMRYGIRDWRGGGRASARETISRVIAGAIALQILARYGVGIEAGIISIGKSVELPFLQKMATEGRYEFPTTIPEEILKEVEKARRNQDSIGGKVGCAIYGMPPGIGNPIYGKLQSQLAAAMLSINASKGFDYGYGFPLSEMTGAATADSFRPTTMDPPFHTQRPDLDREMPFFSTSTNYSGGIQGGISNGSPIYMRVAFKPTPSLARDIPTVNDKGENIVVNVKGRHDPCLVLRAVPIVKSMAALATADFLLGAIPFPQKPLYDNGKNQ